MLVKLAAANLSGISKNRRALTFFVLATLLVSGALSTMQVGTRHLHTLPQQATMVPDLSKLPLHFEPNVGQTGPSARFITRAPGGTLYFTPSEVVLSLQADAREQNSGAGSSSGSSQALRPDTQHSQKVVRMQFVGAQSDVNMQRGTSLPGRVNYILGNDPTRWYTDLPTYSAITYLELYPGVDLSYGGAGGRLKGTYTLAPGVSPTLISWRYIGASGVMVNEEGSLVITLPSAQPDSPAPTLIEQAPVAWQEVGGQKVMVRVTYLTHQDGSIGFSLGQYDPSHPLTIDPTLLLPYSSYLGGDGFDVGYSIAVDESGNAYVTGNTSSTDFPVLNQYQTDQPGSDVFVSKLNTQSSGNPSLVYSTYLGGGAADSGLGIAVDGSGNAYVTGNTSSTDFPTLNQYQGDNDPVATDVFVTRLSATGSSLVYSTYLSGNNDELGAGIATDGLGNAYVTGNTFSTNFPILNQFQTDLLHRDAFVTKLNTQLSGSSSLVYSTYLGGNDIDYGHGIAVDRSGNAYITGHTFSNDFPVNNYYQIDQPDIDAFVTKLNTLSSGLASLVYSTYLGGSGQELGYGIAVDGSSNAYVVGYTRSSNFPILNQYQTDQPGSDVFVSKLNTMLSGDPSLVYSTYLGGSDDEEGWGIATDGLGNAYATGYTGSSDFPILNQYQTNQPDRDAFVTKLNTQSSGNSSLVYSTYLGGNDFDYGRGIAIDQAGNAYIGGQTFSSDFPVNNQYQTDQPSSDAFISKLVEPPTATATPIAPTSTPLPTQTPGGPTATPEPTNTPTNTSTATPTATATPTNTATATPTNTSTATSTPTNTSTATSTATATATPTSTPTNTATATATPTNTSTATATPTNTSTATATGTATATSCSIQFTDVPSGSTFYVFVRCLACRNILGGYVDSTFRPGNDITRGQIAKIVSNAAGYADDVTGRQTYTDVPSSQTFWLWVERLSLRGVMGGYNCGGVGEPCDGQNRPYFRPQNNATRGQLSKIVSNAAGYNDPPAGQQFEDVPPTNTFYAEIQRLASRGIMGGYPCGGTGEPCVLPGNRPYFRPASNVTRGQASKIVANTFYPNCVTP